MTQPGLPTAPPWGQKLRYGAEAALFFAFMGMFRMLGPETASGLGGWIGRNIFSLLPPDRVARANLAAAFPEMTADERNRIRRSMWDNLGRVVGEYPHLARFSPKGDDPRITYSLPPGMSLDDLKQKPVIFLSAHLGNWEMMQLGFDGAAVVRPPNNPYVAAWVARQRRINGPDTLIAKHNAARPMVAQLKAGKMLCMLVDQKLREGIPAPFFGRDALTTPAPAALALKMGAHIVMAANRRVGGPRFHVTVQPELEFRASGSEAEDVTRLTAAIQACIEEMVRANPGQWLWIHNRWTTPRDIALLQARAETKS
jgi:KDO2-lipid IV(A) lauroyltransferase